MAKNNVDMPERPGQGKIWRGAVHSYSRKPNRAQAGTGSFHLLEVEVAARTTRQMNPLDQRRWNSKGFGAEAEERRCVLGDNIAAGEHTVAVATVQECGFERPPCSAVWHPPTAACPQDKRPQRASMAPTDHFTFTWWLKTEVSTNLREKKTSRDALK